MAASAIGNRDTSKYQMHHPLLALGLASLLAAGIPIATGAAPSAPAASGPATPLASCGRALCDASGARFRWRGVTAFALADLVADGRRPEAEAFARWAADTGFTVLRVLAMNHGWMDLSPEAGRRALPAVFRLARQYGLIVQVVALAGTGTERFEREAFLRTQVREVARLCAAAGNCVLEIANEPYHSSQAALHDPALMRRLQGEVPAGLPVAWGAALEDDSVRMAGGTYMVGHLDRNGDRWTRVARVRLLEALSRRTGKFVVDNEPIGAAGRPEPGRRDDAPGAFFAQGLLARLFEVGSTLHCEDCLDAKVPGAIQARAARAFVEGATLIPPDVTLTSFPPGAPDGPIPDRPNPAGGDAAPIFAAADGHRGWAVRLGAPARPVVWRTGWRAVRQSTPWPEVEVWRLER